MLYEFVHAVDKQLIVETFTEDNVIPAMSARGCSLTGFNNNHRHRKELQGQPMFSGICGPMWGGEKDGKPCIRYECTEAYRRLSN